MRIAHVVSLISPDGAYGGPVSVALNLARELRDRGNDVVLFAAQSGYDQMLREHEGVPVKTVKARYVVPGARFAGLAAPGMSRLIKRSGPFDVFHVHMARDLMTLPIAHSRSRVAPLVTQTHGMVVESKHPLAPLVDGLLTKTVWKRSQANLYLTQAERQSLEVAGAVRERLAHLPNGIRRSEPTSVPVSPAEVVYMARLHPRKRPMTFLRAAEQLLREGIDAVFTIIGADEGEEKRLREAISVSPCRESIRLLGAIPHAEVLPRLNQASLYVLPSVNEPFPMSVLEAASLGIPVIVTESCGVADQVARYGAGAVAGTSQTALTDAIRGLVTDPLRLHRAGMAAATMVDEEFALSAVVDRLERVYANAIASFGRADRSRL